MSTAVIYGCAGPTLSPDEVAFFREADPWGFILFRRNLETEDQARALCAALRDTVGWHAPILVDHEGGRVARLSPQISPKRPPTALYGQVALVKGMETGRQAARLGGELLARDASSVGINVNCVPMIDVRQPDANEQVIGDRALGEEVQTVIALGRALYEGSLLGGCLPVIKHMPGHGRSTVDSHYDLPVVTADRATLEAVDFQPFKAFQDAALGMTAHLVYTAIDPDNPGTLSSTIIGDVIRREIGFEGLLMTDDLSMKALGGDFGERTRRALEAGCDVILHCNGDPAEMQAIASEVDSLEGLSLSRANRALAQLSTPSEIDMNSLEVQFASLANGVNLA